MAKNLQLYPKNPTSFLDLASTAGRVKSPFSAALGDFASERVMNDMNYFMTAESKATFTKQDNGSPYSVQKLADTIIHKTMLDGLETWYNEIAPFQIVGPDVHQLNWTTTTFDPSMALPTPELGTVRLVTAQREAKKAQLARFGIGYYMEMGFSDTPQGRFFHFMHIMQMQSGILEVIYADTITTCITAHESNAALMRARNAFNGKDVNQALYEEAWMFGSMQKLEYALNNLMTLAQEKITLMGGQATTWIVPQKFESFLALNAREYTSFMEAGARGPANIIDNRVSFNMIGGNKVYFSRSFEIGEGQNDNMLSRPRQVGEYIAMYDFEQTDDDNYLSKHRNIEVMNEDLDNWHEVSMQWGLQHCQLWDNDGSVRAPWKGQYSVGTEAGGLSAAETRLDLFTYAARVDGQPDEIRDVDLFGQMEDAYFNLRNKLSLARTIRAKMLREMDRAKFDRVDAALNAGVDLAHRIDQLPWTKATQDKIYALFAPGITGTGPSPRASSTLTPTFNFLELRQDPATRFVAHNPAVALDQLLPGLQTHYGLEFIAKNGTAAIAEERRIAADYVSAIKAVVAVVRRILKRCIYLDPSLSSTNVWYPSAEGAWFEKVLFPYRPAMFFQTAGVGGGAAGFASYGTAASTVQNDILRQASEFVNSVNPSIQPRNLNLGNGTDEEIYRVFLTAGLLRTISEGKPFNQAIADDVKTAFGFNSAGELITRWGSTLEEVKSNIKGAVRKVQALGLLPLLSPESKIDSYLNRLVSHVDSLLSASSAPGQGLVSGPSRAQRRSGLVAGPAFAISLAANARRNNDAPTTGAGGVDNQVLLWPGDPFLDEFPITLNALYDYTAHLGSAGVLPGAAQISSEKLASIPGWGTSQGFIGASSHDASHTWEFSQSGFSAISLSQQVGLNVPLPPAAPQGIGAYYGLQQAVAESIPADAARGVYGRIAGDMAQELRNQPAFAEEPNVSKRQSSASLERMLQLIEGMVGQNFHRSWNAINHQESDLLTRALALSYDATVVHRDVFEALVANDCRVPISFLYCRPHITYEMMMAVFLKPGGETLLNCIKPGKFMMNTDAATQAHFGSLTMESACIPVNSRNIVVLHDIFFNGYKGGNGVVPITPEAYQGGTGQFYGRSVIVIAVPYNLPNAGEPISLAGHWSAAKYQNKGIVPDPSLHYITAARYSSLYGFNSASRSVVSRDNYLLEANSTDLNQEMLGASHRRYNPVTKLFDIYVAGKDYNGGNVFPGVNAVHNGRASYTKALGLVKAN